LENIESNNTVEVSKALKAGLVVAASSLASQIISLVVLLIQFVHFFVLLESVLVQNVMFLFVDEN